MANNQDTISSLIPGHIRESYPRFVEFMEAYYEWLHKEDNPYGRIKHHMDYLNFERSLNSFVSAMKEEYLKDIPEKVLVDKELFIKWSKDFHLIRGSHASYKFLFRLLFGEDTTEIYLPKENILRASDGVWIANESQMIVTASGDLNDFIFQIIEQERETSPDVFEYATAIVQRAEYRYYGRYRVIQLSISDIDGEFQLDYPIKTETGGMEWILPVASTFSIQNGGVNNQISDTLSSVNYDKIYTIERFVDEEGLFDTRTTTYFNKTDLQVFVEGEEIFEFEFDGRYVLSEVFDESSYVLVRMPAHLGYSIVSNTTLDGSVTEIDILEPVIGVDKDITFQASNYGDSTTFDLFYYDDEYFEDQYFQTNYVLGFSAVAQPSTVRKLKGYYENNRGHLSSNMYLQDSFYYQNYSYVIKTEQDISKYSEIVKEVLHPAGFKFFGNMNIVGLLELMISLEDVTVEFPSQQYLETPKYSLGPNYSFLERFKAGLSQRLYRLYHFVDKDKDWMYEHYEGLYDPMSPTDSLLDLYSYEFTYPEYVRDSYIVDIRKPNLEYYYSRYNIEYVASNASIYVLNKYNYEYVNPFYVNESYIVSSSGEYVDESYIEDTYYNLEDQSLERTYVNDGNFGQYFDNFYFEDEYFSTQGALVVNGVGWMTKHYFVDMDIYIDQDYSNETESSDQYFENGFVTKRVET